jgi:hypothetical protein
MGQVASDVLSIGSVIAAPFTAGTSLSFLPAALGGASSILGMFDAQAQQRAQNAQYQTALGNQSKALGQAESLAQQEAQGPYLQDIINAEGSGAKTLQTEMGGVANPALQIQSLLGGNITNAINGSLAQRDTNLSQASNTLTNVAGGYNSMKPQASSANPYATAASGLFSSLLQSGGGSAMPTGSSTALGGTTGGDIPGNPANSSFFNTGTGGGFGDPSLIGLVGGTGGSNPYNTGTGGWYQPGGGAT